MEKSKQSANDRNNNNLDMLLRASEACKRRYGKYPNVIGIGVGQEFTHGSPLANNLCIHFYVTQKFSEITLKKLPRFVYARTPDGKIDRSIKINTDVIELKKLSLVCKAGTEIGVIGEAGTITIIFRNKILGSSDFYLVTCAHVAGNLRQSPPTDPSINSSCCNSNTILASTIVNSTQQQGNVFYDIALAKIIPECTPQPELQVIESSVVLQRFLPSNEIRIGMQISCAFPISNVQSATVSSLRTSLPVIVDGREYLFNNLFLIDRMPREGDSGGLLYDGTDAIGILVAKSEGWGLFQPLGEAFEHLQEISPVSISCF
ncbi:hypothetical protein [Methylobacter sp.]|uniref:hypothetical protein n=1 Tax=Methylobacter sp. TaxID=2051955 RepID=UPI00248A5A7A|nr:hypothetical protein [Methylobacter sp.]MDI1279424.1 hypothetical protein [Methylobacter sp.]MDI1360181.1 hypothetical protein [Methylobacter sp.]